jgi:16S rRNA (cytosine1402-N4)-methyltransferase
MPDAEQWPHVPVMAGEALEWLRIRPDGTYVDGTAGAGGHAQLIAHKLTTGRLIALDRDPAAVTLAGARLKEFEGVARVVRANYADLAAVLSDLGISALDGVLIDAGVSSMQIDDPGRGFSFQADGPLDMRMDTEAPLTALDYLHSAGEQMLAEDLKRYGDVRPARRVAQAICKRRAAGALKRTGDLAEAVREALPFVKGEPAEVRTVFQAVRMAVNAELAGLEAGLTQAAAALRPGGRLVVITFHSGEDRVVKNLLRDLSRPRRLLHADGRVRAVEPAHLRLLTPGPIVPDTAEIAANPRAKSARLRAAERVNEEEAS